MPSPLWQKDSASCRGTVETAETRRTSCCKKNRHLVFCSIFMYKVGCTSASTSRRTVADCEGKSGAVVLDLDNDVVGRHHDAAIRSGGDGCECRNADRYILSLEKGLACQISPS